MDKREQNSLAIGNSLCLERGTEVYRDLIYDVGMNNGDDTAYFLHQGYRVLAIEANPVLARQAEGRFEKETREGRLIVLNVGFLMTIQNGAPLTVILPLDLGAVITRLKSRLRRSDRFLMSMVFRTI